MKHIKSYEMHRSVNNMIRLENEVSDDSEDNEELDDSEGKGDSDDSLDFEMERRSNFDEGI